MDGQLDTVESKESDHYVSTDRNVFFDQIKNLQDQNEELRNELRHVMPLR
jgi:hypothetical protein